MTTTDQTTCPDWCTEQDRRHPNSPLAHSGPGYEVRSDHGDVVETWAATDDYGAPVVGMFASTSVELTVQQAQQLVSQLQAAIRWCANPEPAQDSDIPTASGFHLDGCTLDPQHRGACLLDRPFRIRPEGGREYLGGDR